MTLRREKQIFICCVERESAFCFLRMEIQNNLTWGANTKQLLNKVEYRLYFLRLLRKNHLLQKPLFAFYICSAGSILIYYMCVWFSPSLREEIPPEAYQVSRQSDRLHSPSPKHTVPDPSVGDVRESKLSQPV